MPRRPSSLRPRKLPSQERSTATVEAIYTATIQVLLADGTARLTTTRVAERAGVSVGTMYQYFPHKQALLFAIVERHVAKVEARAVRNFRAIGSRPLAEASEQIALAWLDAKTRDLTESQAIYRVASDFDLSELLEAATARFRGLIEQVLTKVPDARFRETEETSFTVAALLIGATRAALEGKAVEAQLRILRCELPRACCAYLRAVAEDNSAP